MTTIRESGEMALRKNEFWEIGGHIMGHSHEHPHTTFILKGWCIGRERVAHVGEKIVQFCAPQYAEMRKLLQELAPERLTRPIRMPDRVGDDGVPMFTVVHIKAGEEIPAGGTEIFFKPTGGYHALILEGVEHEFLWLSEQGESVCAYFHRDPKTGDVVLQANGWHGAYQ